MQTMKQAAAEFLAGNRVNPDADKVEGDTCYHDLKAIRGGVGWQVIGTRPEQPMPDPEPDEPRELF